jgi:hypothetical protein
MVAVQDLLGAHQDATVDVDQLRELASGSTGLPGPTIFMMGRMAERALEDARALRSRFPKTYRGLNAKPLARLRKELRTSKRAVRTPMKPSPDLDET